jgi:hypothetical protein
VVVREARDGVAKRERDTRRREIDRVSECV